MGIHCDEKRAETLDTEFPQRLGIEIIKIDFFDLLDPGRLLVVVPMQIGA